MRALERPSPAAVCKGHTNILWVRTSDLEWSLSQFVSCTLLVTWACCCPMASPTGRSPQRVAPTRAIPPSVSLYGKHCWQAGTEGTPNAQDPRDKAALWTDRCSYALARALCRVVSDQQIRNAVINPAAQMFTATVIVMWLCHLGYDLRMLPFQNIEQGDLENGLWIVVFHFPPHFICTSNSVMFNL